jgi:hypothetical protein
MITISIAEPVTNKGRLNEEFGKYIKALSQIKSMYSGIKDETSYVDKIDELESTIDKVCYSLRAWLLRLLKSKDTFNPSDDELYSIARKVLWNKFAKVSDILQGNELLPRTLDINEQGDVGSKMLPYYGKFEATKRSNLIKVGKYVSELNVAFNNFLDAAMNIDFTEYEEYQVDTVNVRLLNEDRLNQKDKIKAVLDLLHEWNLRLNITGLKRAYLNLTVSLRFKDIPVPKQYGINSYAGWYNPTTDDLSIFLNKLDIDAIDRVYFHELGHRFWFKILNAKARDHWSESLSQIIVKFTQVHIDSLLSLYNKSSRSRLDKFKDAPLDLKYLRFLVNTSKLTDIDKQTIVLVIRELEKEQRSSKWRDMYYNFMDSNKYTTHADHQFTDIKVLCKYLEKFKGSVQLKGEFVTNYAKTDPKEFFAETFMLYMTDRSKIKERTMEYFRQIVQTEGIVLAKVQ